MARSKREIPHYYLSTTIDLARALRLARRRQRRTIGRPSGSSPLRCCSRPRPRRRPGARDERYWLDDAFAPADRVDLGVAVSLRGGGLVAPAIADADELGLEELMARAPRPGHPGPGRLAAQLGDGRADA